jgi:hypothetical protein
VTFSYLCPNLNIASSSHPEFARSLTIINPTSNYAMKKVLRTLAVGLLTLASAESSAQNRDFAAERLILDDNAGGRLEISYTGPGSSTFTIPPGGATTVQPGTLAGQTLRWDGTQWLTSGALLNDGANLSFPGTLTGNGSLLTTLNASNLSSGTVNDARLSSNVPLKNAANTFTAGNTFNGNVLIDPTGSTSFSINNLFTLVSGRDIVGGDLPLIALGDANGLVFGTGGGQTLGRIFRLVQDNAVDRFYDMGIDGSGNFFITNQAATTTAFQINVGGGVTIPTGNLAVTTGTLSGNGSGLTTLNASNLSSGTVADARLSTNVALLGDNETVGGTWTFSNTIGGNINGNAATVTNGVYTTGNQTIGGNKNFSAPTTFSNIITATPQEVEITSDGEAIASLTSSLLMVGSDSFTATDRTFTIPDGSFHGQVLMIAPVNGSGYAELVTAGNVQSSVPALNIGLPYGGVILVWNSAYWVEIAHGDN